MAIDPRYSKILIERQKYSYDMVKTGDCSVVSLSLACRMSYKKAYSIITNFGTLKYNAPTWEQFEAALEYTKCRIEKIYPRQPNGSRYTPLTIGRDYPKGCYICAISGHVFVLINGKILDWIAGRRHHINHMYKITKPRNLINE